MIEKGHSWSPSSCKAWETQVADAFFSDSSTHEVFTLCISSFLQRWTHLSLLVNGIFKAWLLLSPFSFSHLLSPCLFLPGFSPLHHISPVPLRRPPAFLWEAVPQAAIHWPSPVTDTAGHGLEELSQCDIHMSLPWAIWAILGLPSHLSRGKTQFATAIDFSSVHAQLQLLDFWNSALYALSSLTAKVWPGQASSSFQVSTPIDSNAVQQWSNSDPSGNKSNLSGETVRRALISLRPRLAAEKDQEMESCSLNLHSVSRDRLHSMPLCTCLAHATCFFVFFIVQIGWGHSGKSPCRLCPVSIACQHSWWLKPNWFSILWWCFFWVMFSIFKIVQMLKVVYDFGKCWSFCHLLYLLCKVYVSQALMLFLLAIFHMERTLSQSLPFSLKPKDAKETELSKQIRRHMFFPQQQNALGSQPT